MGALFHFFPLFFAALLSQVEAAIKHDVPRPDPFADPAHDPYNPLKYIASNTLTAIAFCKLYSHRYNFIIKALLRMY